MLWTTVPLTCTACQQDVTQVGMLLTCACREVVLPATVPRPRPWEPRAVAPGETDTTREETP